MKKMPDTLLVVDCEATCWEKPKDQPAGQKNEIIQISMVPLSLRNLTVGEPKSLFVKPSTSKVSRFCTRITSLTQEQVDAGISFKEACEHLVKEFSSKTTPWVSWTDYDCKQFQYQCKEMKVDYPFGAGHWDFSTTFAKMMGLEHDVSLTIALKIVGLEFEGARHSDANEAFNIARVMIETFRRVRG